MSTDCLFCKIISGDIPSDQVYQDERVTAFRDINPKAPTHILIVPNEHIASVNELSEQDKDLIGHMFLVEKRLAQQEGVAQSGYRTIINTGPDSGQEVQHLHLHLLGGQRMRHPMG
jgi:histidine triad (HIT) family protein